MARPVKTEAFIAHDLAELMARMQEIAAGDLCWVTANAFENFRATAYRIPSDVPYTVIGDAPMQARGYWRRGRLHPFSAAKMIQHQNAGLGRD